MERTFESFVALAQQKHAEYRGEMRYGQVVFNTLHHVRPDIAKQLVGTREDPFYRDYVDMPTWEFISSRWEQD